MIKYPEFSDAGDATKSLIAGIRGGTVDAPLYTKCGWVLGGYAIGLTIGEPGAPVAPSPPGTLKLSAAPEELPSFDEAADTLTTHFRSDWRTGKPTPALVKSIIVLLKVAAATLGPQYAALVQTIIGLIEAAGQS